MATKLDKAPADVQVYETTDYDLFSLFPENRKVNPDRVRRLKRLIEECNLLHLYPMIVTPEGKILDGQHRLAAASQLGATVYYVIADQDTPLTMIAKVANATSGWRRDDYLHHYCALRLDHYLALRDFWRRYEDWMPLTVATAVCVGEPANSTLSERQRELFNTGQYRITDMRFAMQFVDQMEGWRKHFRYTSDRPFLAALSYLIRHPDYNGERMLEKLAAYPGMMVRCPDRASYLRVMEELYNYRSRGVKTRFQ